jgi:hypothetical protein
MKKIDAVKMMRDIRDKLSERYKSSPAKEKEDLKAIHKKCRRGEISKK